MHIERDAWRKQCQVMELCRWNAVWDLEQRGRVISEAGRWQVYQAALSMEGARDMRVVVVDV